MDVVAVERSQRIKVASGGRICVHGHLHGTSLARPDEPLGVDIIAVSGRIESHCQSSHALVVSSAGTA
jgi:hypothetical protein